jgi:hypothetical protein
MKVLNGERPARPSGPRTMSDTLWRHVSEFWAETPTARPSTRSVVQKMVWRAPPVPLLRSTQSAPSAPLTPVPDLLGPTSINQTSASLSSVQKTAVQPDTASIPLLTDDKPEGDLLRSVLAVADGRDGNADSPCDRVLSSHHTLDSVKAVAAAATSSSEGPMTATSTHTPPPPPKKRKWWPGKPLDALLNSSYIYFPYATILDEYI